MPFATQIERNKLAQAIWGLRTSAGLRQQDLAKRIGVSVATLGRLEKNAEPTWPVLDALAQIARERGLPQLAEVFQAELNKRREEFTPNIDEFFFSNKVKQIHVNKFYELALLIYQIAEDWSDIEPAIDPASYVHEASRKRLTELKQNLEENLRRAKELIYRYGGRDTEVTP